jgi:curli biogenesis system outer membrane secretion channel CsgG
MIPGLIVLLMLFATIQNPPAQQAQKAPEPPPTTVAPDISAQFLRVHRICVESFGNDAASVELQAMVINALSESKRFALTESSDETGKCNEAKADAVLKGVSVQRAHEEVHSSSEGTSINTHRNGASINESSHSTELIDEARLAVRLVMRETGDVIWSTTQESKGAKYKGANADAADKVVKQLLRDLDKLREERARDASKKPSATP